MPAACSACRCWEVFAVDCPLAPRELVDAARRLREQVEQLEPHGAGERLAHQRDRFEQRRPSLRRRTHHCYSIDHLIACQALSTNAEAVFFRQLLNDDTACASYLLGCKTHGQFAVVDPHVDLVDDYIALAEAQGVADRRGARDARAGRPRLRACRRSSSAPARPPTCPRAPASTFEHHALADGEVVELGNTVIEAIATPGHAPAHHAYLVTDHRRARRAVAGPDRRRAAGRRRRPARPARPRRAHRRGDGAHAVPLADRAAARAARPPAALPGALLGLGLRARALGQPGLDDRLRAPPQHARCGSTPRTRSSRRCSRTSRPRPSSRPRSSPPTAPAGRSPTSREPRRGPARAAREPRAVLAAGRRQRVRRRDGRPRALDAAADRPRGLRARVERRGALVHRRLRARQVAHQPRRRRAGRARSAAGGC